MGIFFFVTLYPKVCNLFDVPQQYYFTFVKNEDPYVFPEKTLNPNDSDLSGHEH